MTINEEVLRMVIKPIWKEESTAGPFVMVNILQGISDTIFEVMYGASEDLHSKASEVVMALLEL
mgnify:CR=1 FL=1